MSERGRLTLQNSCHRRLILKGVEDTEHSWIEGRELASTTKQTTRSLSSLPLPAMAGHPFREPLSSSPHFTWHKSHLRVTIHVRIDLCSRPARTQLDVWEGKGGRAEG